MKNIILCGFMGCGKSTIGRIVSKKTGMEFIDMDRYIELKTGLSVKEIFERFGEDEFRRLEREACRELSDRDNLIIAAGGGTLTFDENIEVLSKTGRIVFIDVCLSQLCDRLKNDKKRPLLQVENRNERIRELLEVRRPIYKRAATIEIDGNFNSSVVAGYVIGILSPR
jgi:shikimate kinase